MVGPALAVLNFCTAPCPIPHLIYSDWVDGSHPHICWVSAPVHASGKIDCYTRPLPPFKWLQHPLLCCHTYNTDRVIVVSASSV